MLPSGFEYETRGGLLAVRATCAPEGFLALFTTRVALHTSGPKFCNYGFYGRPGAAKTRARLCETYGLDPAKLTAGEQTHTATVALVGPHEAGRGGLDKSKRIPNTDALTTALPKSPIVVMTADCVPILLADPAKRAAAAIHAGWRGSLQGIVSNAVSTMRDKFGSRPRDITAMIGPHICGRCYTFGEDAAAQIPEKFALLRIGDELKLDLAAWNTALLRAAGIPRKNIFHSGLCTACRTDLLYSYRADKRNMGSNASLIALI